jgi:hypothetical protein
MTAQKPEISLLDFQLPTSYFPTTKTQPIYRTPLPSMVLPVEFKPPTMYSTQSNVRTEIEQLVREHHQSNLLGKDGRIYDKAIVM